MLHLPTGGSAPDGKSGRYAACRASGSADSEAKADVITRVASQSVMRSSLRGVNVLMALTRAWLFGGDLSTAMKNLVVPRSSMSLISVANVANDSI